jgi:hypothetical protein
MLRILARSRNDADCGESLPSKDHSNHTLSTVHAYLNLSQKGDAKAYAVYACEPRYAGARLKESLPALYKRLGENNEP